MKRNSFNHRVAKLAASQLNVKMTGHDRYILRSYLRKAVFFRTILGLLGAYFCYYLLHSITVVVTYHSETFLINYYLLIHSLIWGILATGYCFLNVRTLRIYEDMRDGAKEILVQHIGGLLKSIHTIKAPNLVDNIHPLYNDEHFFYLQAEEYWIQTDYLTFESAAQGKKLEIHRGLKSGVVLQAKL